MAAGVHLSRYYNQQLQPLYNKALPTPTSAAYYVEKRRLESGYRQAHTLIKTPVQPLLGSLKANTFWPLTVESSSQLVPPRPCYAPWPTNTKKRKMNAMVQKKDDLPEGSFYRTLKIRLHPSEAQRPVLRQWFAAARLFGNQTVACLNDFRDFDPEDYTYPELRAYVREIVTTDHPWTAGINQQITANAVQASWNDLQTNFAKLRKNPNHRFKMSFKSLRRIDITPTEVINCGVPGNKSQGLFKGFLPAAGLRAIGGSRMDFECRFGGDMPGAIRASDSSKWALRLLEEKNTKFAPVLMWEKRTRRFYLIVKYVTQRPADTKPPEEQVPIALDRGARKPCAFYRPDGTHGELMKGAEPYVKRMCKRAAKLQSLEAKASNHDGWKHYREQKLRTFARLRNWTKNAHYESIKHIFTLGDFIIDPIFETERMSRRASRVIGNSTAQKLYTWAHYTWSQRLFFKSQTTANKRVVFTREPGTSKTCDCCGTWHPSLGDNETFTCRSCGYTADRDHHGARGNLLSAVGAAAGVGPDGVER
jgi:transposase